MRFDVIPFADLGAQLSKSTRKTKRVSKPAEGRGYRWADIYPVPPTAKASKFQGCIHLVSKTKTHCEYVMVYRTTYLKGKKRRPQPRTWNARKKKFEGIWDSQFDGWWDGTGMARLRIDASGRITVLTDSVAKTGDHLEDSRLVSWNGNMFIQYSDLFSVWETYDVPESTLNPRFKERCVWGGRGNCFSIGMVPVKLTKKGGFKHSGPAKLVCQDKTTPTEKNWAFIEGPKQKEMVFQYSFAPLKFLASTPGPNGPVSCREIYPKKSTFFARLHKFYGSDVIPHPSVSGIACTTPLVPFNKDYYIGAGHVKVSYKYLKPKSRKPIHKFIREVQSRLGMEGIHPNDWSKHSKDIHPGYVYTMFFYTIHRKTLELGKVSDAFTPQSKDLGYFNTIVFPMSIQPFVGQQYAISMGIADTDTAILTASKRELEKLMIHSNTSAPSNFRFYLRD